MTPALIFLGVGDAATVVTADLTAAAVYKTGGAIVHKREGSPHMRLATWLVIGSVPMALLGPLPHQLARSARRPRPDPQAVHRLRAALRSGRPTPCGSTSTCGGCAPAATPTTRTRSSGPSRRCCRRPRRPARRHHQRRLRVGHHDRAADALPRPSAPCSWSAPTWSRPSRSCWPPRSPTSRCTGSTGPSSSRWSSARCPGTILGSLIAPRVPQSIIRRGIVVVLTMSGVALLDKAGWAPLGAGEHETHPGLIALVGWSPSCCCPWSGASCAAPPGCPMFGAPTLAQVEDPTYRPGGFRAPKPEPPTSPIVGKSAAAATSTSSSAAD